MPSMHVQAHHGVRRVGVSGSHNARHHGRHDDATPPPCVPTSSGRSCSPRTVRSRGSRSSTSPRRPTPTSSPTCGPTRRPGPTRSVLVAEHQAGGRGRAGRSWETPAGTSLTCSFVVRPPVPAASLGWLGLLAGLGAVNALRATAGVPAMLKWPNDLLVPADTEVEGWGAARKIGGILAEVVAAARRAAAGGRHRDRDQRVPGRRRAARCRAPRRSRSRARSTWTARGCSSRSSTRSSRWPAGGATPAGTRSGPGSPTRSRAVVRHARRHRAGRAAGRRRRSAGVAVRLDDDGGLVVRRRRRAPSTTCSRVTYATSARPGELPSTRAGRSIAGPRLPRVDGG